MGDGEVPVLLAAKRIRITKGSKVSRPVFGGDGVFFVDRDSCTKLSRESLELRWRVPIERDSGLAFVQGRTLVLGRLGAFYALDVSDGTRMWGPTRLGACLQWRDEVLSVTPLGTVDLETGALIRTLYPSDDLVRDAALCGDVAVGGANTSDLVAPVTAFHLIEERVLWKRDIIAEATSRAQPHQVTRVAPGEPGIVLLARQDMLFGYSVDQGAFCWQRPVTLSYYLPNAAQGRVYILSVSTTESAHLLCLDVATGSTLYDVPQPLIDRLDHPLRGTLDRDQIAFSTTRGSLLVCRVSDGRPVWSATYPETLRPPVFLDGRVLVSAFDGQVLVFEPPLA